MRTFETTLIVDGQGAAHLDLPLALAPGRHHAVVTIDESLQNSTEPWSAFVDRTYGSLDDSDLVRWPQGPYEGRDEKAH